MSDSSGVRRGMSRLDGILDCWIGQGRPSAQALMNGLLGERPWGRYCHRCGQSAGLGECTESGCGHCRDGLPVLDGVIRLGSYQACLREVIRAFKYQRRAELADPLGRLLAMGLKQGLKAGKRKNMSVVQPGGWVVMPMPMPWARRWVRGLDHARLLADVVGREMGLKVIVPLRKRSGRPQADLGRSARLAAQVGDYRIRRSGIGEFGGSLPSLKGLNVIVIDDVLTTGRSMRAAGTILRRLDPACLLAAVLGVTSKP